ncbi:MAG TPA: hypothetical protein VD927_00880 [Chryseosolibacter sp.]|nr:hypothetical protein [Chryseosolibacter sp.]
MKKFYSHSAREVAFDLFLTAALSMMISAIAAQEYHGAKPFYVTVDAGSLDVIDGKNANLNIDVTVTTHKEKDYPETFGISESKKGLMAFEYLKGKTVWVPISPIDKGKYSFEMTLPYNLVFAKSVSDYVKPEYVNYFRPFNDDVTVGYTSIGSITGKTLFGEEKYLINNVWKSYWRFKSDFTKITYQVVDLAASGGKIISSRLGTREITFTVKEANSLYPINSDRIMFDIKVLNCPTFADRDQLVENLITEIYRDEFKPGLRKDDMLGHMRGMIDNTELNSVFQATGGSTQKMKLSDLGVVQEWQLHVKVTCPGYYFLDEKILVKTTATSLDILLEETGSKIRISDNKNTSRIKVN